jgi:hypothetical protein
MIAKQTMKTVLVALTALVLTVVFHSAAYAGSLSLSLVRAELTNVDDPAGRWQHEAGNILKNNVVVGQYAITRRVTYGGTDVQNTAMTTVTLFFTNSSTPPHNVTLQGAHSFSSGRFAGSVSAASNRYTWIQNADASISATATIGRSTLTISWAGANQLTLP